MRVRRATQCGQLCAYVFADTILAQEVDRRARDHLCREEDPALTRPEDQAKADDLTC